MKLLYLIMLLASFSVNADDNELPIVLTPTIEGTTYEDYLEPKIVITPEGEGYTTIPGTTYREYLKPGYKIERK